MKIKATPSEFYRKLQEDGCALNQIEKRIADGNPPFSSPPTGRPSTTQEAHLKRPGLLSNIIRIGNLDHHLGSGGNV